MIFSLLKLNRKTSAVAGGSMIAVGCLWGIAWWQDLSARELLNLFLGSLFLILGIMALALLLVAVSKMIRALLSGRDIPGTPSHDKTPKDDSKGQPQG